MLALLRPPTIVAGSLLLVLAFIAGGCGDPSDTDEGDCPVTVYLYDHDGNEVSTSCAPMPAACGEAPTCGDECKPALDRLCAPDTSPAACAVVTIGQGAETSVSCVLPEE